MITKANLALKVRRTVEAKAKEISPIYDPSTLACLCAISSFCFAKLFNEYNFSAKLIKGKYIDLNGYDYHHCWNRVDNEIWDITATQFDRTYWQPNPRVLRTNAGDIRYAEGIEVKLPMVNLHFESWPVQQQPLNKNVDIILEEFKLQYGRD